MSNNNNILIDATLLRKLGGIEDEYAEGRYSLLGAITIGARTITYHFGPAHPELDEYIAQYVKGLLRIRDGKKSDRANTAREMPPFVKFPETGNLAYLYTNEGAPLRPATQAELNRMRSGNWPFAREVDGKHYWVYVRDIECFFCSRKAVSLFSMTWEKETPFSVDTDSADSSANGDTHIVTDWKPICEEHMGQNSCEVKL